ncbi:hypothetical protein ABTY96_01680 [Streptomyces sp. NPDC096057]|uniref:hypothetical protein n=1 Tax=Streptomyces sp. NPDC096057 TaxID=3155543 RepID=UPI0033178869
MSSIRSVVLAVLRSPVWTSTTGTSRRSFAGHVESRGGNYVGTYDEPDTSAWKKKRVKQPDGTTVYRVIRPVFEGSLKDLKNGSPVSGHFTPLDGIDPHTAVNGLIVYDVDRLTRDNRHLEDAIEVVQYFHRPILDIRGSLDLLTDNGRQAARHIVAVHNGASAATSRRLKDSHASRAVRGIPVGGNRPFGWADDKRTIIEEEAEQIRQAAKHPGGHWTGHHRGTRKGSAPPKATHGVAGR